MEAADVIKVRYQYIDGVHFFTAGDAKSKGLCAAHPHLRRAFEEVGVQLEALLKNNMNISAKVEPITSFHDFKLFFETKAAEPSTPHPGLTPLIAAEGRWRNAA